MRDIKVYWGIFRYYWGILSHIQTYSELCATLAYTTMPYFEPWLIQNPDASSKTCQTCKIITHFQNPGIVRTVYSSIFKDIHRYSWILMPHSATFAGVPLGASPALFWKLRKVSWFSKKGSRYVHLWVNFPFKV